jgi:hypothetical protein
VKIYKGKAILLLIILVPICLSACNNRNDSKEVREMPEGFIYLEKEGGNWENGLHYVPFETIISFVDADGINIYQTGYSNSDFIVKQKGEYTYYVNEEKFLEVYDMANTVFEQRNKIYGLGDEVKMRDFGENSYTVKVMGVDMIIQENRAEYEIKIMVVSPDLAAEETVLFFDHVETEKGEIIKDFTFAGEGKVKVGLPVDVEIKLIVLKTPEYPECLRKVSVEE